MGEYYWGRDDSNVNPIPDLGGSFNAWCARDGANSRDPTLFFYPDNADSWMVYGPFSLEKYNEARLEFLYWNKSEEDYDFLYYWLLRTARFLVEE